jgi:hypothetical protein
MSVISDITDVIPDPCATIDVEVAAKAALAADVAYATAVPAILVVVETNSDGLGDTPSVIAKGVYGKAG